LQENGTVVVGHVTEDNVRRKRVLMVGGFFWLRKSYRRNNDCMGTDHVSKEK
jgi:hypothetical protein